MWRRFCGFAEVLLSLLLRISYLLIKYMSEKLVFSVTGSVALYSKLRTLQLVLRLRMSGALPPLYLPSLRAQGKFFIYLY
jgi:hypothetical protein